MTKRNQTFNALPVIEQESESRCGGANEIVNINTTPREFGDRMAKHRRLRDRRLPFAFPKLRVMCGQELIVDMWHEALGILRSVQMCKLTTGPISLSKICPRDGVETRIPKPLKWIHVGIWDGVALGPPVLLEHCACRSPNHLGIGR
jgi:hypothetical protein